MFTNEDELFRYRQEPIDQLTNENNNISVLHIEHEWKNSKQLS